MAKQASLQLDNHACMSKPESAAAALSPRQAGRAVAAARTVRTAVRPLPALSGLHASLHGPAQSMRVLMSSRSSMPRACMLPCMLPLGDAAARCMFWPTITKAVAPACCHRLLFVTPRGCAQMGKVLQQLLASYQQDAAPSSGGSSSSASSLDLVSWADDPQQFQASFSFPAAAYRDPWVPAGGCLLGAVLRLGG